MAPESYRFAIDSWCEACEIEANFEISKVGWKVRLELWKTRYRVLDKAPQGGRDVDGRKRVFQKVFWCCLSSRLSMRRIIAR